MQLLTLYGIMCSMARSKAFFATTLATASFGLAGCGNENLHETTPTTAHAQKVTNAAAYLTARIVNHESITYDPTHEIRTAHSHIPVPLLRDGKRFQLTGTVEHPKVTLIEHPELHKLQRLADSEIVSHSGVVEMNPVSGVPAVDATLKDGSHLQLAVAYPIPTAR